MRGVVISVEYISVDFQRVWWIPMGPMGPCRALRALQTSWVRGVVAPLPGERISRIPTLRNFKFVCLVERACGASESSKKAIPEKSGMYPVFLRVPKRRRHANRAKMLEKSGITFF